MTFFSPLGLDRIIFSLLLKKNTRKVSLSLHKIKNEKNIFCGKGEINLDEVFAQKELQTLVIDLYAAKATRYAHLSKPIEW